MEWLSAISAPRIPKRSPKDLIVKDLVAQRFVSKKDRIEKAITGRIFSRQVYVVFSINIGNIIQFLAQDYLHFLTAAS